MNEVNKMDFYEKKRRVKMDLNKWLSDDDREPFSEFAQKYGDIYGFDTSMVEKIFIKFFPALKIEDEKPLRVDK